MNRLVFGTLTALILLTQTAEARRYYYPHRHYSYQGGHYAGGIGSSHKGGHYLNWRTHNHYTHHLSLY